MGHLQRKEILVFVDLPEDERVVQTMDGYPESILDEAERFHPSLPIGKTSLRVFDRTILNKLHTSGSPRLNEAPKQGVC
jgi:hypothetical protein